MSEFIINTKDGMLYVADWMFPNVKDGARHVRIPKPPKEPTYSSIEDIANIPSVDDYWGFYRVTTSNGVYWRYEEKRQNGNYSDIINYFMSSM
jgi:hypothetical protein